MIISTGMADFKTVKEAYDLISKVNPNIAILQMYLPFNIAKTY